MNRKIGLIAGNGRFPLLLAKQAKEMGIDISCVAIKEEVDTDLDPYVSDIERISLYELDRIIDFFHSKGIEIAVMAGQVKHVHLFSEVERKGRVASILSRVKNNKTDSLLKAVAEELHKEGISLMDSSIYLTSFLPKPGVLTKRKPSEEEKEDIKFGYGIAKELARLDIGQTIVVKNRSVVAVEAIEGTDRCIFRAGKIGGRGGVVIKVAKPGQDMRFDIPVVGLKTIDILKEAGIAAMAFDSRRTLLLDREEVLKNAEALGICLVALDDKGTI